MITHKEVKQIEDAANIRVMGTDTIQGMQAIDADIWNRTEQVRCGLISTAEAINLIKEG